MRNPTGSIARNPTDPRSRPRSTPCRPAADRAAPRAARWRAGSASWRLSPSRANGASASSPVRRTAAQRGPSDPPRDGRLGLLAPADEPGRFRVGRGPRPDRPAGGRAPRYPPGRPAVPRARIGGDRRDRRPRLYDPHRRQFSAVDAVETSHPIRYIWESLRDWSDLHLGSSGKGILAFLPDDEREAILDRLPDPVPGRTADQGAAAGELDAARQRGYVVSHGERYEGAVGVSAPIRDGPGASSAT